MGAPILGPVMVLATNDDPGVSLVIVMFAMIGIALLGIGLLLYRDFRGEERRVQQAKDAQRFVDQLERVGTRQEAQAEALNRLINAGAEQAASMRNLANTLSTGMTDVTAAMKEHMTQSMHNWQMHLGDKP